MITFSGKNPEPPEGTISNQPFWPDMDLNSFSVSFRIPSDLDQNSVEEHLIQAMTDINFRLCDYRKEQQGLGYEALEEVPSDKVNNESILLVLYRRAASYRAKATICRDYPTIDRRQPADNQAKSAPDTEETYLRFADEAVRQFLEITDISVELL